MIDWMLAKRRRWRESGAKDRVEACTLWTLIALPWIMFVTAALDLLTAWVSDPLPSALSCAILALGVFQCVLAAGPLRRAVGHYLGSEAVPRARLALLAGSMAVLTALAVLLAANGGVQGKAAELIVLFGAMTPFLTVYGLVVPIRTTALTYTGYILCTVTAFGASGSMSGAGQLLGSAAALALFCAAMLFSARCSVWYIAVMRELDEARDVQSQLAVAEERLRFGRDLHDVMGRNLSVIALKSELAAQLVRRGAPEAESQMVEVQRIAQASQREVREVVRGYRAADLRTELTGARSILRAAGIDCRIDEDGETELPEPVQSALGWVVREGTTNVLRHAGAGRCGVTLRVSTPDGRAAVLAMENDGVGRGAAADGPGPGARRRSGSGANGSGANGSAANGSGTNGSDANGSGTDAPPAGVGEDGQGGSGIPGLRERLAALGGTLLAERPSGGSFRLTARIPIRAEAEQLRGAELR